MGKLPEGWHESELENFFEINYGKNLPKSKRMGGPFPVYGSNGVVGFHNQSLTQSNAIVIGRKGSVGKINFSKLPCWPIDTTYYIDIFDIIIPTFAHYLLHELKLFKLESSSAIPGINRGKIYKLKAPLPPLAEQHRIASRLDKLMPRLDALQERLSRIPKLIKRFRQSVLTAAVTGKLTEKWREEHPEVEDASVLLEYLLKERKRKFNEECKKTVRGGKGKNREEPKYENRKIQIEIPACWKTVSTSTLFYFVTSGSRGWAKYYSKTGAAFIRITNLNYNSLSIDLSDQKVKRVKIPEKSEGKRTKITGGDFLFSITGDVGMVAIAPNGIEESYVNQHIALARPINGFLGNFVGYFFQARSGGLSQLKALQKGVTKAGLGLDDILNVVVPLPPLAEQREIVRQVDKLFSLADKLESHYEAARAKIGKLPQSVLSKAFSGRLVPTEAELARQEGRDYESAAQLLERIIAEKARLENQTAKRKPSKRAAGTPTKKSPRKVKG